jgi:putative ABC transport system substrate-binding protein
MRRREFITLLGGAAAAACPLRTRAAAQIPVIGSLFAQSAPQWADYIEAFRKGLTDVGFVEGQSVAIEYRWAEGEFHRLPALAADLVNRNVAVLFTGGSIVAVRAALAATQTIPIVFTSGVDPVAAGVVQALNRPNGNATGVTLVNSELGQKKLEILHEAIPTAAKIALLVNRNNPVTTQEDIGDAQAAARQLGLEMLVLDAGTETEIESAFLAAAQHHVAAMMIGSDAFHIARRAQIAALALRNALPTISSTREAVMASELLSYGASHTAMYRQAGIYVARILKGEKPGNLPVVQPSKFELVINLTTAKALGIALPPKLLALADEVIE